MRMGFLQTLSCGSKKVLVHLRNIILGLGKPDAKYDYIVPPTPSCIRNNKFIVPTYTVPFILFLSPMPLQYLLMTSSALLKSNALAPYKVGSNAGSQCPLRLPFSTPFSTTPFPASPLLVINHPQSTASASTSLPLPLPQLEIICRPSTPSASPFSVSNTHNSRYTPPSLSSSRNQLTLFW